MSKHRWKAFPWVPAETVGFVYFIQVEPDGPVKIGLAEKPDHRLMELQCGCPYPLVIRKLFPGEYLEEQVAHEHCRGEHLRGEWFNPGPLVRALMEADEPPEWWWKRRTRHEYEVVTNRHCEQCGIEIAGPRSTSTNTHCNACMEVKALRDAGVDPMDNKVGYREARKRAA